MMTEKQFAESQKECAKMLGMSLEEYIEYCKNVKVPMDETHCEKEDEEETLELLDFLGIDKSKLKKRKD